MAKQESSMTLDEFKHEALRILRVGGVTYRDNPRQLEEIQRASKPGELNATINAVILSQAISATTRSDLNNLKKLMKVRFPELG